MTVGDANCVNALAIYIIYIIELSSNVHRIGINAYVDTGVHAWKMRMRRSSSANSSANFMMLLRSIWPQRLAVTQPESAPSTRCRAQYRNRV